MKASLSAPSSTVPAVDRAACPVSPKPPRRVADDSRSTNARRYRIHKIFLRDRYTNCKRLARELEVGVRTVVRDIDAMRNEDYPIDYDPSRRAFFYREPVYNLPSVQITSSDLLALRAASAALNQNEGTPFHRRLTRIYRILLTGVQCQDVRFSEDRIGAAISFYRVGVGILEPETFETLTKAVLSSQEVEFEYLKPDAYLPKLHRVLPYFITNRDNLFYLIGQDYGETGLKSFAITRITSPVQITGKKFIRDRRFSLRKRFEYSFRSFGDGIPQHVALRVNRRAAPFIKERRWHHSEKMTDLADGEVLLEMNITDMRDIRSWILRWGCDVEVLEPSTLRQDIARAAKNMAEIYK